MKALTVVQPWPFAINALGKDIENRPWKTAHRGLFAIHAGARWDLGGACDEQLLKALVTYSQTSGSFDPPLRVAGVRPGGMPYSVLPDPRRFILSAVVAVAELVDITRDDPSPWARRGHHHWRLANVRPLPVPVACRGWLGLWNLPEHVEAAVAAQTLHTIQENS